MEDPDVPQVVNESGLFIHWIVFNIPGTKTTIVENQPVGTFGR